MDSCLTRLPKVIKQSAASGVILTFLGPALCLACMAMQAQNRSQEIPEFYRQYVRRENVDTSARAELRNGLKVIVEEYAVRPVAAVTMVVGDGVCRRRRFQHRSRLRAGLVDSPALGAG